MQGFISGGAVRWWSQPLIAAVEAAMVCFAFLINHSRSAPQAAIAFSCAISGIFLIISEAKSVAPLQRTLPASQKWDLCEYEYENGQAIWHRAADIATA